MFVRKRTLCTVAVIAGTAMVGATVAPAAASASAPPKLKVVKTLSSDFVGPLQFAVNGKQVVVADNLTSTLSQLGVSAPIATNPGENHEIAGVGIDPATGAIAYTTATSVGEEGVHTASSVVIKRAGKPDVVADTFGFEQSHNPDRIIQYGAVGPISACARKAIEKASGGPAKYRGQLDTHPYAVTPLGGGAWAVADAGGNDILRVEPNGNVSTLAVLPPQPLKITAALAKENKLPKCVVGITYRSEAVPTDVEVGPHGKLVVSVLAGGIAPFGSVYTLDSHGYNTPQRIATGIPSATNVAVDPAGNVYVASLFAGAVFEIPAGSSNPVPVLSLPGVAALEFANGHLYASTAPAVVGGSGPGTIVQLGKA
jgi:hypothetical protein